MIVADERSTPVTVAWFVYQNIAYCFTMADKHTGGRKLARLIDTIGTGLPKGGEEIAQLGRTMHARRDAILAYADTGVSNGAGGGHQRAPGAPTRHRPGLSATSPTFVLTGPTALRPTPAHLLSTLDYEEPHFPRRPHPMAHVAGRHR